MKLKKYNYSSSNWLKKIKNFTLDLLFPIHCLGCQKEGIWICPDCFNSIPINNEQICPRCLKPSELGKFCPACSKNSNLKGVIVASSYQNQILKEAIHTLKYRFVQDLSLPLGKILARSLKESIFEKYKKEDFLIIPVPLHKRRINYRGFNQASLLAKIISQEFNIPVKEKIILRTKHTSPQTELKAEQRRSNILNAFKYVGNNSLNNKRIILIDDVLTTGSTMEECAKIIKKYGNPKEIWGAVLARG